MRGILGTAPKKTPKVDPRYASVNRRMLAATADTVIMAIVWPFFAGVVNALYTNPAPDMLTVLQQAQAAGTDAEVVRMLIESGALTHWLVDNAIQTFVLLMATGICWAYWSATPGKMLFRIKIVDAETGAPISGHQVVLRLAGYVVSGVVLCLGFFWIGFDPRRQGWHDKMAGTVVIRTHLK